MTKYLFHILLFFLSILHPLAQNIEIDSLLGLVKKDKEDSNKVKHLINLSIQYKINGNYANGLKYGEEALTLAKKQKPSTYCVKKNIGTAYVVIGNIYLEKNNYSEALKNYSVGLEIRQEIGDKQGIANTFNNIGNVYINQGNYPLALKNHFAALKIRQEIGDKYGMASSYNNLGNIYDGQSNYPEALKNSYSALKILHEIGDKKAMADAYNNIGTIYDSQGNYPEALKNHFASLKIREEIKDKQGLSNSFNNLGNIYVQQGNYSEAIKNYFASLELRKEIGDMYGLSGSYNNIGNIYADQGNYSGALKNYTEGLKISQELVDKLGIATSLNNIGNIYIETGDYLRALQNCSEALKIREQIGDKEGMAMASINLGWAQTKLNKLTDAKFYLNKALQLSRKIGHKQQIKSSYKHLATLDSILGNFKSAYSNYRLYIIYRDSLNNEESRKKTIQSAMTYEFEKKEAVAKLIQEKKDAIAKSEREKQTAIANAESKRQQIFIWLVAAVALAIGFITVVVFRSLNVTKKQKNKIESQKKQIEITHKKVSDSINYAQKIQYSILPPEEEIKKYLPNYFVHFQPKDIISGDFYWFYHYNDLSYIAVADCTGHGVPGALMSMTIHSLLDEVMMEEKLTDPGEILSRLHHLVFKTLQQNKGDEYSQDGCDISLCIIDHSKKLLHFSGARNHAYLSDGKNITVLKATSKSIGGLSMLGEPEPERKFKSETVELKENTLLVMSTDGIFDQLNDNDEAFGNTRFKELINSIYSSPIEEGNLLVGAAINNWKKDLHQQDDMLIMGVLLKS